MVSERLIDPICLEDLTEEKISERELDRSEREPSRRGTGGRRALAVPVSSVVLGSGVLDKHAWSLWDEKCGWPEEDEVFYNR